jgi:hypothetical protein
VPRSSPPVFLRAVQPVSVLRTWRPRTNLLVLKGRLPRRQDPFASRGAPQDPSDARPRSAHRDRAATGRVSCSRTGRTGRG